MQELPNTLMMILIRNSSSIRNRSRAKYKIKQHLCKSYNYIDYLTIIKTIR